MSPSAKPSETQSMIPRWRGEPALRSVQHLNAHVLRVLAKRALGPGESSLGILCSLQSAWRALDANACVRAGEVPVLLLDAKCRDADWWRAAESDPLPRPVRDAAPDWLTRRQASDLLRELLMVAWPIAREDASAARLLFGMSPEVVSAIAALMPQQLDAIATRHGHILRLRFADLPHFWGRLLRAAVSQDTAELQDLALYSIQLIGGELLGPVAHRGVRRARRR